MKKIIIIINLQWTRREFFFLGRICRGGGRTRNLIIVIRVYIIGRFTRIFFVTFYCAGDKRKKDDYSLFINTRRRICYFIYNIFLTTLYTIIIINIIGSSDRVCVVAAPSSPSAAAEDEITVGCTPYTRIYVYREKICVHTRLFFFF